MLKRVLMIGLAVGVGLMTLQTGTAQAGGWSFLLPPGMWWYYGSIDGCGTVTQVRNPDQFPAQLKCSILVTKVETLCENPQNHSVSPGNASTQVVFTTENPIDQSDLNSKEQKDKGKASLCVSVDDNDCSIDPDTGLPRSPLCDPEFCVNPNWHPIDVLTSEFRATCTTELCTGTDPNNPCSDTVVKDTEVCQCTLPAGYSVENQPVPCADPLNPDPTCTAYSCIELDAVTLAPTGQQCALQ